MCIQITNAHICIYKFFFGCIYKFIIYIHMYTHVSAEYLSYIHVYVDYKCIYKRKREW